MNLPLLIRLGAQTDTGRKRAHNEDRFVVGTDLSAGRWDVLPDTAFPVGPLGVVLMVADGMGGMQAGEHASEIAVGAVRALFSGLSALPASDEAALDHVKEALMTAHRAVADDVVRNPRRAGMGTTAVLAWIIADGVFLAWSGDSRGYLLTPEGELDLLTSDHSLVWELVKLGHLTPEEARRHPESNLITQSLGDDFHRPVPDVARARLMPGCRLLLCSDGLNGMLSDDEIRRLLSDDAPPRRTCAALIDAANEAGGLDNITVVLLDVVPSGARA
jgi:protein phosphatase